jgi:hypothetical protein
LAGYRAFGRTLGWEVLGLHQDLSQRYPVAPLLAARSAQAELALVGPWDGWSALVASVLVRPDARPGARAPSDLVVQLTILDTGPLSPQFTATVGGSGPEVALLTGRDEHLHRLQQALTGAVGGPDLWPGDPWPRTRSSCCTGGRSRRQSPDLAGPLRLLSALARRCRRDLDPQNTADEALRAAAA